MRFIGIDPGKSGGIAVITENDYLATKMPDTLMGVLSHIEAIKTAAETRGEKVFAILERVASSPQQGVCSAFTFGQGYGALQMALLAARIPFDRVTPQQWQKFMRCLTKGNKNVSKARAEELFPKLKITHAIADALLIAEYARRTHAVTKPEPEPQPA